MNIIMITEEYSKSNNEGWSIWLRSYLSAKTVFKFVVKILLASRSL